MVIDQNTGMKTILYLSISILLIIAVYCEKDKDDYIPEIVGKWNWIYSFVSINSPVPNTPLSTGINELLVFNPDNTWYKTQNNIRIDSGSYSIGHGSYTPYMGAKTYNYNSITYYQNGTKIIDKTDYFVISDDTLLFNPGFAGLVAKSDLTSGLSRFYIRK